jgi:chromosome segregation ATPase
MAEPTLQVWTSQIRKLLAEHDQVLAELETARRRVAELTAERDELQKAFDDSACHGCGHSNSDCRCGR